MTFAEFRKFFKASFKRILTYFYNSITIFFSSFLSALKALVAIENFFPYSAGCSLSPRRNQRERQRSMSSFTLFKDPALFSKESKARRSQRAKLRNLVGSASDTSPSLS